jgi:hypothetical protein
MHNTQVPKAIDAQGFPFCYATSGQPFNTTQTYDYTRISAQPTTLGAMCDLMREFQASAVFQAGQNEVHFAARQWEMTGQIRIPSGQYVQEITSICPTVSAAWRSSVLEITLANTQPTVVSVVLDLNTTNITNSACNSRTPFDIPAYPGQAVKNVADCGDVTITVSRFDLNTAVSPAVFILTPCGAPITQATITTLKNGYVGIPVDVQTVIVTANNEIQQNLYNINRNAQLIQYQQVRQSAINSGQLAQYSEQLAGIEQQLNSQNYTQSITQFNASIAASITASISQGILNLTQQLAASANASAAAYYSVLPLLSQLSDNVSAGVEEIRQSKAQIDADLFIIRNDTENLAKIPFLFDLINITIFHGTPVAQLTNGFLDILGDAISDSISGAINGVETGGSALVKAIWNGILQLPGLAKDLLGAFVSTMLFPIIIIVLVIGGLLFVGAAAFGIKKLVDHQKAKAAQARAAAGPGGSGENQRLVNASSSSSSAGPSAPASSATGSTPSKKRRDRRNRKNRAKQSEQPKVRDFRVRMDGDPSEEDSDEIDEDSEPNNDEKSTRQRGSGGSDV